MSNIRERVDAIEWSTVADGLDELGIAATGPMLDGDECRALIELYDSTDRFRSLESGPAAAGSPARGVTRSTNGSLSATLQGSYGRRH